MHAAQQLGNVVEARVERFDDARHAFALRRIDHRRRAERQQADERADLEPRGRAIRQAQHVVVKAILLVPHAIVADLVQGGADPQEVLGKLEDEIVVAGIVSGQLDRDLEHVLAEHRHPRGAVGLLEMSAGRQLGAAIEDADVVEAEETALEHALPEPILAIDPPREIDQELAERALQELDVAFAAHRLLGAILIERRPRVHRRVDVAEVPLVGRQLSVRMLIARLQHQRELMLGQVRIDARHADGVKREIPCRVPRVLPLVRHRDDVVVEHVEPLAVPDMSVRLRIERIDAVLAQPHVDVEEVVLLRPEHAGEGLAHHRCGVVRGGVGRAIAIEVVGFLTPGRHRLHRTLRTAWPETYQ